MRVIYRIFKTGERGLLFWVRYVRYLGLRKGLRFCWANMRRGRIIEIRPPGVEHPIRLRSKTSDIPAFEDTFIFGHYEFEFEREPRAIIDAGAHIGLVSVLFATRYPRATIIAIEPEPGNFALLSENTRPYPNVAPVQRALWFEEDRLRISNPGDKTWSFRVEAAIDGAVDTITILGIMDQFGLGVVDLLKIDIEGAEKPVMENSRDWIDKIGALVIELHEGLAPGCTRAFYEATGEFRAERRVGENTIVSTPQFPFKTGD